MPSVYSTLEVLDTTALVGESIMWSDSAYLMFNSETESEQGFYTACSSVTSLPDVLSHSLELYNEPAVAEKKDISMQEAMERSKYRETNEVLTNEHDGELKHQQLDVTPEDGETDTFDYDSDETVYLELPPAWPMSRKIQIELPKTKTTRKQKVKDNLVNFFACNNYFRKTNK